MSIFGDIKRGRIPGTGGKGKIPNPGKAVDVPKQVAREVEKAVPDAVKKELGKTLKSAIQQFFKLLFNPLNRKALNVLKHAAPDTVWLTVGIVTFTINDIEGKADRIEYWMQHPPVDKGGMKRMVKELQPADVEIALRGNVPGLSVGVGATLIYLPETFIDRLDGIWGEIRDFI